MDEYGDQEDEHGVWFKTSQQQPLCRGPTGTTTQPRPTLRPAKLVASFISLEADIMLTLKMPSKLIRILRITFSDTQLCGRCLVHMTPVVKVVIHCVFALL